MFTMEYVTSEYIDFWFTLDKHIEKEELNRKIRDEMGYIIKYNKKLIGILRYNLFWDSIPFLNLIYIDKLY